MAKVASRFAGLGRNQALLVCLLLLAMVAAAAWAADRAPPPHLRANDRAQSDANLYRGIVAQIEAGGHYYPVTAQALRRGGYPLRPFITFRLPTLAWVSATLGERVLRGLQILLVGAILFAWSRRWRQTVSTPEWIAALLMLSAGLVGSLQAPAAQFQECWAGMLLAVAVSLDRKDRNAAALLAGLAAVLIRELSLPLLLAFAGLALVEGRRRAALSWAVVIAIFAVALALHAGAVGAVVLPTDRASPGWNGMLGPGFALRSLKEVTGLALLTPGPAAVLLTLSLFGLVSVPNRWAVRAALMVAGYMAMIALFARTDTFYWALMAAPFSLVGLAFVPRALGDLAAALRPVASQVE